MDHRLIVDQEGRVGPSEFPIPDSGLNIDVNGPTSGDPVFRVEIHDGGAILHHFENGRCDEPAEPGGRRIPASPNRSKSSHCVRSREPGQRPMPWKPS
jgi:hypothetical protein